MRRLLIVLMMVVTASLATGGCGRVPAHWKGQQSMRDIYLNLMTGEQQAEFRQMEADEVDEEKRILYCQEIGVYQKWRSVPEDLQPAIRSGKVAEGMRPVEVQMAWGPPAKVEDITTAAERSEGHKRQLWNFMPRTDKEGFVSHQRQACFLDERLLWYKDFHKKRLWRRFLPKK